MAINFEPKNGDFEKLTDQLTQGRANLNSGSGVSGSVFAGTNYSGSGFTGANVPSELFSGSMTQNPLSTSPKRSKQQAQAAHDQYQEELKARLNQKRQARAQAAQNQAKSQRKPKAKPATTTAVRRNAADPTQPNRTAFKWYMFAMTFLVVLGVATDGEFEMMLKWYILLFALAFAGFFFMLTWFSDRRAEKKSQTSQQSKA